jgi:hypothetical protein
VGFTFAAPLRAVQDRVDAERAVVARAAQPLAQGAAHLPQSKIRILKIAFP